MSEIKVKQNNEKTIEDDERVFASLMYVFPFQPFIYIMLKCTDYYTDFVKKHLKNSVILYSILLGITAIAIGMSNIEASGTLQVVCATIYLIMFIASIILLIIICIRAFLVFKK